MKLDIGCGKNKAEGYIGVDHSLNSNADIIHDLEDFPWKLAWRRLRERERQSAPPIPDNSVSEIRASHVLEHIHNLDGVMHEIWRVGKPGAKVLIKVPNAWGCGQYVNPHHCRGFIRGSFNYYQGYEDFMKLFKVIKCPSILTNIPILREIPHRWFDELRFELAVVKEAVA